MLNRVVVAEAAQVGESVKARQAREQCVEDVFKYQDLRRRGFIYIIYIF